MPFFILAYMRFGFKTKDRMQALEEFKKVMLKLTCWSMAVRDSTYLMLHMLLITMCPNTLGITMQLEELEAKFEGEAFTYANTLSFLWLNP